MKAWINNSLWLVTEKPSPTHPKLGEVHGYTEPYKKRIVIDSTLPYEEKLETYLHEFLHAAGTEVDIEILYGNTADEDLVNDIISAIMYYFSNGLAMYRRNKDIAEQIFTIIFSKALSDYCTDDESKELAIVYTDVVFNFITTIF
jgi:hypothetical protein